MTKHTPISQLKTVNQSKMKLDAMTLVTGKPVYTDDLAPANCLIVKVLRSPHAFAKIADINVANALKVPGIECILTHHDVPKTRFTMAGQSYPEPSPYDRLILDEYVRYVGDAVAIVAGHDEKAIAKAMKLIKVRYDVLTPVLDFTQSLDHSVVIHPESDYHTNFPIGNDVQRNLCASESFASGDIEAEFADCDIVLEETYHTKANNQAMMETFRTYTYLDHHNRLNVVSSTQVPFHVRRITARALEIPKSQVRVIKPRIGGGFGAKQTLVSELFPAIVTLKTGKPAKIVFDRYETFSASTSRHEMQITVKIGADKQGNIKALEVYTLSNTGAYGEHSSTTVGLSGHKTLPLYNKAKAFKFSCHVVYSNTMSAGAFRGYGATQGTFAMESTINLLATKLGMDPLVLREQNMVSVGEIMPAYYNELLQSCTLDRCLQRGKALIGWHDKYPAIAISPTKIRAVGVAVTMQGSAISGLDVASVQVKLNDDGFYNLMIGATDMGTGCDTVLGQIAAECLECPLDNIVVNGVDTDISPYDTGSYASSTTYLTGKAVVEACQQLREQIIQQGAIRLQLPSAEVAFDGDVIYHIINPDHHLTLNALAQDLVLGELGAYLVGTSMQSSPVSPPPFMAGFVEIELDKETGHYDIINYVGVVDCGTPINPNLARIQTEGGIAQGIGMAMYEDITYDALGKMQNNSFMQYKIPSRLDVGNIMVEFESSYEPTGPFGAKSIGEVVINTPCPAIAHAIYNATGCQMQTLPMTAEKVYEAIHSHDH